MWFVLVLSLLSAMAMPSHGNEDPDIVIFELAPYDPAKLEKQMIELIPSTGYSRESQIRALFQQIRTNLYPNNDDYNRSWLKKLEKCLDIFKTAEAILKKLKLAVGTKWKGHTFKQMVKTYYDPDRNKWYEFSLPTSDQYTLADDHLTSFYKSVQSMIYELQDECFGKDYESVLEKIAKMKKIDGKREKNLNIRISGALKEIKKQCSRLKEAPAFNYDEYFDLFDEVTELQDAFKAKVGSPKNLLSGISKEFDRKADQILKWFQVDDAIVQLSLTSGELDKLGKAFMQEMKTILGNDQTTSKPSANAQKFKDLSEEGFNIRHELSVNISNDLNDRLSEINKKNVEMKEFIQCAEFVIETSFEIGEILNNMLGNWIKSNFIIEPQFITFCGAPYLVPLSMKVEEIKKNAERITKVFENAEKDLIDLWFGDDARSLYNKLKDIKPNMQITVTQLRQIHKFVNKIDEYREEIENIETFMNESIDDYLTEKFHDARNSMRIEMLRNLEKTSVDEICTSSNDATLRLVILKGNTILFDSIAPQRLPKDRIVIAQKRLLSGMASLFQVDLGKNYHDPYAPIKKSKTVTFDMSGTVDSEEFDNKLFGRLIDGKIEMINGKSAMAKVTVPGKTEVEKGAAKKASGITEAEKVSSKKALGTTKELLNTIKNLINYVYDMRDSLKSNWAKLDRDCSRELRRFGKEFVKGTVTTYPDDRTSKEIEEKQKVLVETMKMALNDMKPLCKCDIHKQMLATIEMIEKDNLPEIHEVVDLKNLQSKYDEFKQMINSVTITKFENAMTAIRTFVSDLHTSLISNDMLEETQAKWTNLMKGFRDAGEELKKKIQNSRKIIFEMKIIETIEKVNNIFFDKLIDAKIKLLPETSKSTKVALETIKTIPNNVYDMFDRLRSNCMELEKDSLESFESTADGISNSIYPDDLLAIMKEIEIERRNAIVNMENAFDDFVLLYNSDIHKQILESVKIIEKDGFRPEINEKFDLKSFQSNYDAFKHIINSETIRKMLNAISEIRKYIDDIQKSTNTIKAFEKSEVRRDVLLKEFRKAVDDLKSKTQKARKTIFDIKIMEDLERIVHTIFVQLIDGKIKFLPKTCIGTIKALETLKSISNGANDMYNRLKFNWIELKKDSLIKIAPIYLGTEEGTIEQYPDKIILREIESKQINFITNIKSNLDDLKQLYNGQLHKQILETIIKIESHHYPVIDEPILTEDVQLKYGQFIELIHDKTVSKFINGLSNIRKLIAELPKTEISEDLFEQYENDLCDSIDIFRDISEELEMKISKSFEIIDEIPVIEVLENIMAEMMWKMAKNGEQFDENMRFIHFHKRPSVKIPEGIEPIKKILKPNSAPILINKYEHVAPDHYDDGKFVEIPLFSNELKTGNAKPSIDKMKPSKIPVLIIPIDLKSSTVPSNAVEPMKKSPTGTINPSHEKVTPNEVSDKIVDAIPMRNTNTMFKANGDSSNLITQN